LNVRGLVYGRAKRNTKLTLDIKPSNLFAKIVLIMAALIPGTKSYVLHGLSWLARLPVWPAGNRSYPGHVRRHGEKQSLEAWPQFRSVLLLLSQFVKPFVGFHSFRPFPNSRVSKTMVAGCQIIHHPVTHLVRFDLPKYIYKYTGNACELPS
jgi:hypothetical protein